MARTHAELFLPLGKHRPKARKVWQSVLGAVSSAELPRMQTGIGKYVGDYDEEFDQEAQEAFSPVINLIEAIESGARLVRPLTKQEAKDIVSESRYRQSDTVDGDDLNESQKALGYLEEFAKELVKLLEEYTKPGEGGDVSEDP